MFVKFAIAVVSLAQINSPSPNPIIKGAYFLATTKEEVATARNIAKAYEPYGS